MSELPISQLAIHNKEEPLLEGSLITFESHKCGLSKGISSYFIHLLLLGFIPVWAVATVIDISCDHIFVGKSSYYVTDIYDCCKTGWAAQDPDFSLSVLLILIKFVW